MDRRLLLRAHDHHPADQAAGPARRHRGPAQCLRPPTSKCGARHRRRPQRAGGPPPPLLGGGHHRAAGRGGPRRRTVHRPQLPLPLDRHLDRHSAITLYGLGILFGQAGMLSIAHAALMGVGAYTAAILAGSFGLGFWSSIPFAMVVRPSSPAFGPALAARRRPSLHHHHLRLRRPLQHHHDERRLLHRCRGRPRCRLRRPPARHQPRQDF